MFGWIGQCAQGIKTWLRSAWRCFFSAGRGDLPLDDFAEKAKQACGLLDFLITEGHPYQIPNQIIDDLEGCRWIVINRGTPSQDDRTKLQKSYRDLVNISATAITIDGVPPAQFWSHNSWWPWSLLAFSITPSLIIYFVCARQPHWSVVYLIVSILAIVTFYAFTGIASDRKLNHMIKLCYLFTVLALAASVLPWASSWFNDGSKQTPLSVLRGCLIGATTGDKGEVLCQQKENQQKENEYQWVINIGGVPSEKPDSAATANAGPAAATTIKKYEIRGGIVVPLYIIVLALFGSAISMTRRVPEFQRRAMRSQDPLSNEEAREDLVFQIMQVLSAPLIAITAYYIFTPSSPAASVVLGFGSGFSSEPILLMIRGLVDKLTPAAPARSSAVSVSVRVEPAAATVGPGGTQQFTAKVSGSPNSDVTWIIAPSDGSAGTISQSGGFVAPNSISAKTTATVTACSAADRSKCGSATITLQP